MTASAPPQQQTATARERLIVALDFATIREAEALVTTLGDSVNFYKIGLELAYGGGLPYAQDLIKDGKQVFLDLKLHDIAATVSRACAQVARLGAEFLTIHAYPQTMKAAKLAAAGSSLRLLGVTVLTSYDDCDLADAGYAYGVMDLVARRGPGARSEPRRSDPFRQGGGRRARTFWPGYDPRDPWNTVGWRGVRRPEKNDDARCRHCRRSGLSRRWPAGHAGDESARGGGGDHR
jgi:Orotidine 5'-phosphate decarboxylase / HUMPS family